MNKTLTELCEKLNQSNSTNEKVVVLSQYKDNKELLCLLSLIYDDVIHQFNITSSNIIKNKHLGGGGCLYGSLNALLDALSRRVVTGHAAIRAVLAYIEANPEYEQLVYNAIDRNLKCRIGVSQLNKAFPGLIVTFDVALGVALSDYDPQRKKIDFADTSPAWYMSRKLDGNRCIVLIGDKGDVRLLSRSGSPLPTLEVLRKQFAATDLCNVMLDGEVCIVDEHGNENFSSIMSEIRRKDHVIQNPVFYCFDYMDINDFYRGTGEDPFSRRCCNMTVDLAPLQANGLLPSIRLLDQAIVHSWDEVDAFMAGAAARGWEGAILRRDVVYKGKRSNDIIKVKEWHDAEYQVEGVDIGPFQLVSYDENGKSFADESDMVTALNIIHKGYKVSVGSGMSISERQSWYKDPTQIIGKVITVKYFEETTDQNGNLSLRFPIFKTLHGDTRVI